MVNARSLLRQSAICVIFGLLPLSVTPAGPIHDSLGILLPVTAPRPSMTLDAPFTTLRVHDLSNLQLSITNYGVFPTPGYPDPKTGLAAPGAYFPAGFTFEHIHRASIWIGAVVGSPTGNDTLVSTGLDARLSLRELLPESYAAGGDFIDRSDNPTSPNYDPEATSPQEFICTYTDTITNRSYVNYDWETMRPHRPLGIKVRQVSNVWPYEYAEDFVIIQYWITNMYSRPLHSVYVGFMVYPSVRHIMNRKRMVGGENMTGFLPTVRIITGHDFADTVMTAWWADADGDPYHRTSWYEYSVRSVMGLRILGIGRNAADRDRGPLKRSYNWWSGPYGPQRKPGDRSIDGGYGIPLGDPQRYRYLSNGEIDYDQHLTNQEEMEDAGWRAAPDVAADLGGRLINHADGSVIELLLSAGPFELAPGDSIPIGLAIVGGDLFHRNPRNGRNLPKRPYEWYKNLDFSDLNRNIQWAARIYDNPGVDTDDDGYRGRYFTANCQDTLICYDEYCFEWNDTIICLNDYCLETESCDTIFYAGDGIPDLKGPTAPPSPRITIRTAPNTIRIRWDGREIEHVFDPFIQREDFEGYNVYGGIGDNPVKATLMASWDLVNFDRYRFVPAARPSPWVLDGPPLTLEQIAIQQDPIVDPFAYDDKMFPYEDEDGNLFYFKPHAGNRGNEYLEGGIITTNPIQYLRTDSLWDERSQTWKRFGHYECTIDNLLASQSYYVAVTAFDAGVAAGGMESLESPIQANMQLAYPTYSPEYVEEKRLKISVYPNPYKIDAEYRQRGYEDPNREGFKERVRRIHFVNLPPKATIKIFSLDGDLIRELHHPSSRFSDTPSHTAWDLITRNTQAVVSGIYLYTVESDWGTQIGKIVIIK